MTKQWQAEAQPIVCCKQAQLIQLKFRRQANEKGVSNKKTIEF